MISNLIIYNKVGKISDLKHSVEVKNLHGTMGMGHTCWATHVVNLQTGIHIHIPLIRAALR
jgi:glucosamine--fructose-6-phosphate aminotransferase (isomerizing)